MYALGIDYGTNSCRSLLLNLETGAEVAATVFPYPSGEDGILTDPSNPHLARQNPQDYLTGCENTITQALTEAKKIVPGFEVSQVVGLGVDTTGSTILPVDQEGQPLAFDSRFRDNLNAQVWLWKDHTSTAEAEEITELAQEIRPHFLAKCGGTYSSEWWWSKILRLLRCDPEVYSATHSFVEICDWLPAVLTGQKDPTTFPRSICAAGHKALFNAEWNGLPDEEFLASLEPALAELRPRLFQEAHPSTHQAGELSAEWAQRLGLPEGLPVAVGGFDAHMGAVGAGVGPGKLVKILGTSTCDITVGASDLPDVPGLCGQVLGSVLPDLVGVEAGQSAVGDLFLWIANHLTPARFGETLDQKLTQLTQEANTLTPGETGLLALDWNNGNRTILTDTRLTGLLLGQTLHTQAHEVYRAYLEATAFGARAIIERTEEYGVAISEVICTGGLSIKNPLLMQIYADVLNRPLKVSAGEQTCARGAALFGASCAGYAPISELQERLTQYRDTDYQPNPEHREIYDSLYQLYRELHDGFAATGDLQNYSQIMKRLLTLQQSTHA